MGQVTIRLNGYGHTIGCKDGEESHVLELVAQIEEKVKVIRSMGGQFSESRMLLHVCLLLADEAGDLRAALEQAGAGPAANGQPAAGHAPPDPALADRLARIAERVEGIARTLDHP